MARFPKKSGPPINQRTIKKQTFKKLVFSKKKKKMGGSLFSHWGNREIFFQKACPLFFLASVIFIIVPEN